MAASKPASVDEYLQALPEDRRASLEQVRSTVLAHLPEGYTEEMQYGMIGYVVPHSRFPQGYHCDPKQPLPFLHLASQKSHMAIYLFCLYMQGEAQQQAFVDAWKATGKKLDIGKSCIRFRDADSLALDLIGELIQQATLERFLALYATQDPRERKKR